MRLSLSVSMKSKKHLFMFSLLALSIFIKTPSEKGAGSPSGEEGVGVFMLWLTDDSGCTVVVSDALFRASFGTNECHLLDLSIFIKFIKAPSAEGAGSPSEEGASWLVLCLDDVPGCIVIVTEQFLRSNSGSL